MNIRKATETDLDAIFNIYDEIHTAEEAGQLTIGWMRDIYPTRKTAEESIVRGDMFVLDHNGLEKQTVIAPDGTDITETVEKAVALLTAHSF